MGLRTRLAAADILLGCSQVLEVRRSPVEHRKAVDRMRLGLDIVVAEDILRSFADRIGLVGCTDRMGQTS